MNIGINLVGASYGLFPSIASIDYYAAQGFQHIRLPFSWEALQHSLGGALDVDYVAQIRTVVDHAASLGMSVILDPHNDGAYNGNLIGTAEVPISSFADLWTRLTDVFADSSNVIYGLMNEPQLANAGTWLQAVNAAIDAIRDAGGTQQILVPGIIWSGAWSWTTSTNGSVIGAPGAVVDPLHNFAFEVHQYLDDTSGTHDWVVSETIGVERLQAITQWARDAGVMLHLGEFGVAANTMSIAALTNMMNFLQANQDVWQGAAYWAGGPSWNNYMYSVEPGMGLLDTAQMDVLQQFGDAHTIFTAIGNGQTRVETIVDGRDVPSIVDILDAHSNLISRSLYTESGLLDRILVVQLDHSYVVTDYAVPGQGYPATTTTYNADHLRTDLSVIAADGSREISHFEPGAWDPFHHEYYSARGHITQAVDHTGSAFVITNYVDNAVNTVETYNGNWVLETRSTYGSNGVQISRLIEHTDGTHTIEHFNEVTGVITSRFDFSTNWTNTARSEFSLDGRLTQTTHDLPDGNHQIEHFIPGHDDAVRTELTTSDNRLISVTQALVDGSSLTDTYENPGSTTLASRVQHDARGDLVSTTTYDASGHISQVRLELDHGDFQLNVYSQGNSHPSEAVLYHAGQDVPFERIAFDSDGLIASIRHDNHNGSYSIESYYASAQAHPYTIDTFDAAQNLISRSFLDFNGDLLSVEATKGGAKAPIGDVAVCHLPNFDLIDHFFPQESNSSFDNKDQQDTDLHFLPSYHAPIYDLVA